MRIIVIWLFISPLFSGEVCHKGKAGNESVLGHSQLGECLVVDQVLENDCSVFNAGTQCTALIVRNGQIEILDAYANTLNQTVCIHALRRIW